MDLKMTNRYEWRTPNAIHSACVWPDDSVTVRTAVTGDLDDDNNAMPLLSGVIGDAEIVAQLLRRRAAELLTRHSESTWQHRDEQARLAQQTGLCIEIAGHAQEIANEWLGLAKKPAPRAARETLMEQFGTVYAVTLENGEPVLRTAGELHWSNEESEFCPMRINARGEIHEGEPTIVRRRPTLDCTAIRSEYKHSWHEHIWTWLAKNTESTERRNDALIYTGEPPVS